MDRPAGGPPIQEDEMRVMVLIKANEDSEAGIKADEATVKMMVAMGRFNDELVKAGVLLEGDGLTPSSLGKRVAFDGDSRTVIDGPFAEVRELIAGYWIWQVKDMAEAVEWVKRCPNPSMGRSQVEIRPFYELSDIPDGLMSKVAALQEAGG